jgi:hypothetical protein
MSDKDKQLNAPYANLAGGFVTTQEWFDITNPTRQAAMAAAQRMEEANNQLVNPPIPPDERGPRAGGGSAAASSPSDPAGGSAATDPAEEAKAAKDAVESKAPPDTSGASSTTTISEPRGFTDTDFVLMHAYNLVNMRNEKPSDRLSELIANLDKSESTDVATNTLLNLKSPTPYAYNPTKNNPKSCNATIQCYGEPATFLNYVTADPKYQNYLNSTNEQLSSLVPKIRLFKIFHQNNKEEIVEIEFATEGISGTELEDMLSSKGAKRGYGAGIKSFNISYTGDNMATATSTVSATLVIQADSMETLLKPRRGTGDAAKLQYRYLDLGWKVRGGRNSPANAPKGSLEDLNHEIVADIGLAENATTSVLNIDRTSVSLKLNSTGHVFDLQQDGSVIFTVEFEGHIEHTFSKPVQYDVFATQSSVTKNFITQFTIAQLNKQCGVEKATEFKQMMATKDNEEYKKRLTHLNDMLRKRGKLYYITIAPEVLQAYNTSLNSRKKDQHVENLDSIKEDERKATENKIKTAIGILQNALNGVHPSTPETSTGSNIVSSEFVEKEAKEVENDATGQDGNTGSVVLRDCAIDPNTTQVIYFYAGDLINLILENISELYTPSNISNMVDIAMKKAKSTAAASKEEPNADAEQTQENNENLETLATLGLAVGAGATVSEINEAYETYFKEAAKFKKLRVVLGPTMIADFFSSSSIMCSIGDIPIALNHFNRWLGRAMEGSKRQFWSLHEFLNEFVTVYLRSYMMGEHGKTLNSIGQNKLFQKTQHLGYGGKGEIDRLTGYRTNPEYGGRKGLVYEKVPQIERPLIKTNSSKFLYKDKIQAFDYLIFSDHRSEFILPRSPAQHAMSGINTYQHGLDRGIVKDIQYQRTDIPGRKPAAWIASMNGLWQMAEVFNATITTFADFQTYIGQFVYIDPVSISPFLSQETKASLKGIGLTDLGIGGYFVVHQVQHMFEQGKFETKLVTNWHAYANRTHAGKSGGESTFDFGQEVRDYIASRQDPSAQPEQESDNSCKTLAPKTTGTSPSSGGSDSTYEKAANTVTDIFGSLWDSAVGLVKGMFDNTDSEPTAEQLGAQFNAEFNAGRAGLDPDESLGQQMANGPASSGLFGDVR